MLLAVPGVVGVITLFFAVASDLRLFPVLLMTLVHVLLLLVSVHNVRRF